MTWLSEEQQILHELKRTCLVHMYLQSGSAYYNHAIQNLISVPNIVLGATLSVSLFSVHTTWWKIASGTMAIFSTLLSSLDKYIGAGEKAQLHCAAVRQYQVIIHAINQALLLDVDATEKQILLSNHKGSVDKVLTMQPDPALYVVRWFEKRYKREIETVLYPEFQDFEKEVIHTVANTVHRISRHRPSSLHTSSGNNKQTMTRYYSATVDISESI